MTDKERKTNNIHNAIREIYGENVRVEIVVTYDCMECPQCGYFWNYCDNDTERFNYCPNCGAKMESEGKDE